MLQYPCLCSKSAQKELSKNQYCSVGYFFPAKIFQSASQFVIIDELHVVHVFSANLYLLKYLSDQYSSRCISFKSLTTAETQIIAITKINQIHP